MLYSYIKALEYKDIIIIKFLVFGSKMLHKSLIYIDSLPIHRYINTSKYTYNNQETKN